MQLFLLLALVTVILSATSALPQSPAISLQAQLSSDQLPVATLSYDLLSSSPDSSAIPSSAGSILTRAPQSIQFLDGDATHVDAPSPSVGDSVPSPSSPSIHQFRPLQTSAVFTMERLTAVAPWSNRIQPAMLYRQRGLHYTQSNSGINISVTPGSLLLFEGAFRTIANGSAQVENDVWISVDDGRTWDLIAGRSLFGRSGPINASNPNSFSARSGANNCADPVSSVVFSIGGNGLNNAPTNAVWRSTDGLGWAQQTVTFSPARYFSSCDVDESGHVFVIGGNTVINGRSELLNDVWQASVRSTGGQWRRLTDAAPFRGREEHLVLVANSPALRREVLYVIGGEVECLNADCSDSFDGNDVWASSDQGQTWAVISATPPFKGRWGHGGLVTRDGVLVMWGGSTSDSGRYADTYTFREVWASFDGGYEWHSCALPAALQDRLFIRTEQGAALNSRGELVISAGYAYAENGQFQIRYRDVWRSTFSLEDTKALADRCGSQSAIPAAGPGLRRWPGVAPTNERSTLTFTPLVRRAPWSARIQPALLLMNQSRTYTSAVDNTTQNTGPSWLLLYEGSLISTYTATSNENDVWASADHGSTWSLLSGIARQSPYGYAESAHPASSFRSRAGSTNCEDPSNDDVYSIGGGWYLNNGTRVETSDTWYSSDAIHWTLRTGRSFAPARHFTSCDVDSRSQIFLIGGAYFDSTQASGSYYLQDVWTSSNKGITWTRITARAAFPARAEHILQTTHSEVYSTDLIYVAGGFTTGGETLNDVWVSSDSAVSWTQLTARAAWSKRWGHGGAITAAGVMLVVGGTLAGSGSTGNSLSDLWASFDGGVRWTSCRVPTNGQFIRGEQAVALTADERLVIGAGYQYINGGSQRIDYSDLWISDISLTDPATVARYCPGTVPEDGVGLRGVAGWDGASTDPTDPVFEVQGSGGVEPAVIGLVVALLVLGVLTAVFVYFRKRRLGSWFAGAGQDSAKATGTVDHLALTSTAQADFDAALLGQEQSA